MDDKIKIGIFGFGCVGQALYQVITRESLPVEIRGICVKDRHKSRPLPQESFTFNPEDLLNDPQIQLIVELIDDADEAYRIAKKSLQAGKQVVTANKKMVAEHLEELLIWQRSGGQLWYEAAVCGSIPIVKTLDHFYNHQNVQEVLGIFNGSSNYILSRMELEGLDYPTALQRTQALGFAESDPLLDVGGYDTLNKLVILMSHAFGAVTSPTNLFNIGIQHLQPYDMEFARNMNLKVKLIARAVKIQGSIHAYAMPGFLDSTHRLFTIENEYNAVLINGSHTDQHLFTGKGAGGFPTASSVIADIHAAASGRNYQYHKYRQPADVVFSNDVLLPVYMRYRHLKQIEEFNFHRIWNKSDYLECGYVLGEISLSNLWSLQSFAEEEGIMIVDASLLSRPLIWETGIETTGELVY